MTESVTSAAVSRRAVLAGAAALGATGVLAACASGGTTAGSTAAGPVTVSTADVPVGGGKVVGAVVITQPVAGSFKAFSSTCTHQGCTVVGVQNGVIICPCHGSTFSAADGSVRQGPAAFPLPAKTVTVTGSNLTVS